LFWFYPSVVPLLARTDPIPWEILFLPEKHVPIPLRLEVDPKISVICLDQSFILLKIFVLFLLNTWQRYKMLLNYQTFLKKFLKKKKLGSSTRRNI
jgi:hypothetical protein